MKMVRRLVLVSLVLMVAVAFGFAEGQQEGAGAAEETTQEGYTIAYIQPLPNAYYDNSSTGVRLAGDVTVHDVIVYNSDARPEKELSNVEDAIVQDVDGIILFSLSQDAASQAVKKAEDAGIPIHMIYGYNEEFKDVVEGFIQANGMESGRMIGEWVANNIDSGKVGVIQGQLGRGDAEAYSEGFINGLSGNADLEVAVQEPADWDPGKAFSVMEDMITAYPDLRVVFAQNEPMAIAANRALKAQGKDDQVALVSQNGSPEGLGAVKLGAISATVGWSPSQESQIAFARLIKAIEGKSVSPKLMNTPMKVITQDNLDEAYKWVPTAETTKSVLADYGIPEDDFVE